MDTSDDAGTPEGEVQHGEVEREILDALTGIVGYAGLVQTAPSVHRRKFYVDQVTSQADRVRRLVQAFARPGAVRTPFIRPAELAAELSKAVSGLRTALEHRGIGFELEPPAEPVWAACDVRQVGDLVVALIRRATVQQRLDHQAQEVLLRVRPAPGLAVAELVLSGADEPAALLREGFGATPGLDAAGNDGALRTLLLGLQRQGGRCAITRDVAHESVTVTLSLPATQPLRRPDALRTPVPLELLVIDDDPMLGDLYAELFQIAGHAVTACSSLDLAREALRSQRFDAVVAEFQHKDGLLSELWALAADAHPELSSRLVIVTRDPRDARLLEWAAEQHAPILAKPFAPGELLDQVALLV